MLNVKINSKTGSTPDPSQMPPVKEVEEESDIQFKLNIRRAIDGSYMIRDHPYIDIVFSPSKKKITTYCKMNHVDDDSYTIQSQFYNHMHDAGIVDVARVIGGNIYNSLECPVLTPVADTSVSDIVILAISKYIEEEKPAYTYMQAVENGEDERLLEPDEEASTELGEVPHAERKGTIRPQNNRMHTGGL
jgi:hypothetical protein